MVEEIFGSFEFRLAMLSESMGTREHILVYKRYQQKLKKKENKIVSQPFKAWTINTLNILVNNFGIDRNKSTNLTLSCVKESANN